MINVYRKIRRQLMLVKRRVLYRPANREKIHEYWTRPWDGANKPTDYIEGRERSEFLVKLIAQHSKVAAPKILEVGCNVGRNLNYLHEASYRNLNAIEISADAIALLRKTFPEMAASATIHHSPVEEIIRTFGNEQFDVIYTMAVLEHIHNDSSWVFAEIARICGGILITIEDEGHHSWRHFPRNYKKIFTKLGMRQIYEQRCGGIDRFTDVFVARIFVRQ